MLCPEAWKFSPPKSNYKEYTDKVCEHFPFSDFCYTHVVSFVFPNVTIPENLTEILNDCDYYKVEKISLAEFFSEDFIENFVRKGSVTALSIGTKLDNDNCASITSDGNLVLSLDKKTYQELGIEGKISQFSSKRKDRYFIQLNLLNKLNKKQYERIVQCLNERLEKFTLIINWESTNDQVCPSSIAKYFSEKNYTVSLCTPQFVTKTKRNVRMPSMLKTHDDFGYELLEWLGLFALDADSVDSSDGYVNSYESIENCVDVEEVQYLQCRGFFNVQQIRRIYQVLMNLLIVPSPWVSMYIQGFSDSPIAWRLQENRYFTNGDNSFAIFFQSSGESIVCRQSCSNKKIK